ncbi:MAG: potassium channel protein [Desulfosarcinaceae bacterium]|nr:potassium channel protein [Desulfosarcinaceae bacterium]
METTKHFIISVILILLIILIGMGGYMLIEGWSALDSLYMTVITLATVAYGEVHTVSELGRVYTIVLICLGVSYFLYVVGAMIQFMVEGRIRHLLGRTRFDRKIKRLNNHYIVCGYGRIGQVICRKLLSESVDLAVIENNPDRIDAIADDHLLYIIGDATDAAVLMKAGIERAAGLIAVLATDADNVFLVLTARQLNRSILILARASQKRAKAKIQAAGADYVGSPYELGAVNMAQRIVRPTVTNFLDLAFKRGSEEIQMEEIPVSSRSSLGGVKLQDSGIRQDFNLILIAVKKPDGRMIFNPSHETLIQANDTVIAVGETANLTKLGRKLNPKHGQRA